MGAKRVLLIAGGTVGGLGAVLSITPPQFGSGGSLGGLSGHTLGGGASTPAPTTPAPTQTQAAAPAQTQAATPTTPAPATTKKAKAKATTAPAAPAQTQAPAPVPVKAKPSGTFVGDAAQTQFGPVQVQITLSNGKITAAKALVYPTNSFRDQQINSQAIPYLIQETLAAQSANIQGVGGASYTSQGWYDSLLSALAKAGL